MYSRDLRDWWNALTSTEREEFLLKHKMFTFNRRILEEIAACTWYRLASWERKDITELQNKIAAV